MDRPIATLSCPVPSVHITRLLGGFFFRTWLISGPKSKYDLYLSEPRLSLLGFMPKDIFIHRILNDSVIFIIIQRPRLPPREWSVCRCPPPGSTSSGGRPRTPTGTARLEATGTARADGTEKRSEATGTAKM